MDYNRESRKNSSSVDDEVQKLLRRSDKITSQDFLRLRSMYKDEDLVNRIQNAYLEKKGNISKKAKKFAQLIREKYSESQTPFHLLLEKAYKYKVKYSLTDDEFAEFQRIYEQELVGLKSPDILQPTTNLMKVLGGVTVDYRGFVGKLDDSDAKYLQEIVKLHASSRPLHAQVLLQSMQYQDCADEAVMGRYNRDIHRPGDHIHPVITALFTPKFEVVENFFLFSNIAGIVKSRFNGEPLESRPDYELFYALTTDPNDVVCDNRSTVLDLLNRAQLQTQLWNNVLHLRNGQYYNASFKDFIASVDMCRLNKQDSPDLIYGRFDGVIIKRLVSAFSFRPTVVATTPLLVNSISLNPYSYNVRPQVTSVPMINMRLPPLLTNDDEEISLDKAIQQTQFFQTDSGLISPRNTSLIWSRGVLIFFVDRRQSSIDLNTQLNAFSMSKLPAPIAGFERLNSRAITYSDPITLRGDDSYNLKSVVFSEVNRNNGVNEDLVIGSGTLIKSAQNYMYQPYRPVTHAAEPNAFGTVDNAVFKQLAETRGSIFIYANNADINAEKRFM